MRTILLLSALVVAFSTQTACGGGCGGAGAKGLLEKLPAKANAVGLLVVDDLMPKDKRADIITSLESLTDGKKAPAWVAEIEQVAVFGFWKTDGAPRGPDCEGAVDNAIKLLSAEGGIKGDDTMRRLMLEQCKKSPAMAKCMADAKTFDEIASCAPGGMTNARTPTPDFAVVMVGTFKAEQVKSELEAMGMKPNAEVSMAVLDEKSLAMGTAAGMEALQASWSGKADPVTKNAALSKLLDNVDVSHSVVMAGSKLSGLGLDAPVDDVAVSYGLRGGLAIKAFFTAPKEILDQIPGGVRMAKMAMGMAGKEMLGRVKDQTGMTEAQLNDVFDGIKELVDSLDVDIADGAAKVSAKSSLNVQELFGGVLLSTATASFKKYMGRAKTSEAIDMLDKIYKGAAMYASTPMVDTTGAMIPCQFPKTVACTPAFAPCKARKGEGGKYAPEAKVWEAPTWKALRFGVSRPHYYQYCFESSGTGADATFTATAIGDLDCDGVKSTFKRMGVMDQTGGDCSVRGGAALYKEQELE